MEMEEDEAALVNKRDNLREVLSLSLSPPISLSPSLFPTCHVCLRLCVASLLEVFLFTNEGSSEKTRNDPNCYRKTVPAEAQHRTALDAFKRRDRMN